MKLAMQYLLILLLPITLIGCNSTNDQAKPTRNHKAVVYTTVTPHPGLVWVNEDEKVLHFWNSKRFGKTKNGRVMDEGEAIKQGYKPAGERKWERLGRD